MYLGASFVGRVKARLEPELCLVVQRDKRTLRSVLPMGDKGIPDLNNRISVRACTKQRSGVVQVLWGL